MARARRIPRTTSPRTASSIVNPARQRAARARAWPSAHGLSLTVGVSAASIGLPCSIWNCDSDLIQVCRDARDVPKCRICQYAGTGQLQPRNEPRNSLPFRNTSLIAEEPDSCSLSTPAQVSSPPRDITHRGDTDFPSVEACRALCEPGTPAPDASHGRGNSSRWEADQPSREFHAMWHGRHVAWSRHKGKSYRLRSVTGPRAGEDMAHHEVVHDAREQEAQIDHDWYGQRDRGMNLGVVWD